MFRLADEISSISESRQQCMALCVVERVLVAKSLFAEDGESSLVNGLNTIVDELWMMLVDNEELAADGYDRLREQIDDCRPASHDNQQFPFSDLCWILKSVLKVFRGKEHAFEISRLGDAIASISFLSSAIEAENQRRMVDELKAIAKVDEPSVSKLRETIRSLPIGIGEVERDHRD